MKMLQKNIMGYNKNKLIEDMSNNPEYYERINDIIELEGWRYDRTRKHRIRTKTTHLPQNKSRSN